MRRSEMRRNSCIKKRRGNLIRRNRRKRAKRTESRRRLRQRRQRTSRRLSFVFAGAAVSVSVATTGRCCLCPVLLGPARRDIARGSLRAYIKATARARREVRSDTWFKKNGVEPGNRNWGSQVQVRRFVVSSSSRRRVDVEGADASGWAQQTRIGMR